MIDFFFQFHLTLIAEAAVHHKMPRNRITTATTTMVGNTKIHFEAFCLAYVGISCKNKTCITKSKSRMKTDIPKSRSPAEVLVFSKVNIIFHP